MYIWNIVSKWPEAMNSIPWFQRNTQLTQPFANTKWNHCKKRTEHNPNRHEISLENHTQQKIHRTNQKHLLRKMYGVFALIPTGWMRNTYATEMYNSLNYVNMLIMLHEYNLICHYSNTRYSIFGNHTVEMATVVVCWFMLLSN